MTLKNQQLTLILVVLIGLSGLASAQELVAVNLPPAPIPATESLQPAMAQPIGYIESSPVQGSAPKLGQAEQHKFWDTKNRVLFAAVAGVSTADFFVTRANLQSGGRELNPVTRMFSGSTAGLAVNFAGETAGIIGISYMFHKTGHHKLERWTSMLNVASSSTAVAYDLAHR